MNTATITIANWVSFTTTREKDGVQEEGFVNNLPFGVFELRINLDDGSLKSIKMPGQATLGEWFEKYHNPDKVEVIAPEPLVVPRGAKQPVKTKNQSTFAK